MANSKEAKARIKINKLLEEAGWRFFDDEKGPANIQLEPNVKITKRDIDAFGEDFESVKNGFIDFLLLDKKGVPLVVLEAKKEEKDPLDGKEQARRYAQSQNARFIILSNSMLKSEIFMIPASRILFLPIPMPILFHRILQFVHR